MRYLYIYAIEIYVTIDMMDFKRNRIVTIRVSIKNEGFPEWRNDVISFST